jgi:phage shock protein A
METILFRFTLLCYTEDMTAEETIVSLEAQLKQVLEQLTEVTEQLRVAQARIEELEKLKTPAPAFVKA